VGLNGLAKYQSLRKVVNFLILGDTENSYQNEVQATDREQQERCDHREVGDRVAVDLGTNKAL